MIRLLALTWQLVWLWPEQDSECDVDGLEVLGSGHGGHVLGSGSDVEDDGRLHPGDHEVGALSHHTLLHAGESVNSFVV